MNDYNVSHNFSQIQLFFLIEKTWLYTQYFLDTVLLKVSCARNAAFQ